MDTRLLTDTLGSIASTPLVLPALRATVSVVLLFLSGISFSLRFWCIPILRRSPPSPTQVSQFSVIIEQGFAILLPTSQLLAASLLSLTILTASHANPDVSGLWRWHAFSVLVLVVMGRWEKRAIFPVNERILAFDHGVGIGEGAGKGKGGREYTLEQAAELKGLLDVWAAKHPWRIVVPLTCGLITFGVTISQTA
ncbi:uncharacterized protein LA080_011184 [Diaporthe eres]|uniref:Uncharacterized protein n=1 Tax=Diaporthe vaccinii TaxID=105482 RepID=A0ABR4F305_9PEZI|nr:uncharacterized protein LA080_011184 [Diaporthe eres]